MGTNKMAITFLLRESINLQNRIVPFCDVSDKLKHIVNIRIDPVESIL